MGNPFVDALVQYISSHCSSLVTLAQDFLALRFLRALAAKEFLLPPANEVWGKVIFLHLSVILFTGWGVPGQVAPPLAGTYPPGQVHPQQVHPPGRYTPPGQVPPTPRQVPPGSTPPGQVHPPEQVHPPGRHPPTPRQVPLPLGRYPSRAGTPTPGHLPPTPPGRYPSPWAGTTPQAGTPLSRYTLPLLAGTAPLPQCMLGYGQQAGGTHHTGMHSCRSRSLHYSFNAKCCVMKQCRQTRYIKRITSGTGVTFLKASHYVISPQLHKLLRDFTGFLWNFGENRGEGDNCEWAFQNGTPALF